MSVVLSTQCAPGARRRNVLIEEWPELPLSRLCTRFSVHNRVRIIAFIIDHDVVDAIQRHLAKAEARSPRGPPRAAALPAAS